MKAVFLFFIMTCAVLHPMKSQHLPSDSDILEAVIVDNVENDLGINRSCMYSTQITTLPYLINQAGYYCLNNNLSISNTGGFSSGTYTGQAIGQSVAQTVLTSIGQSAINNQISSGILTPQPLPQTINQTSIGQNFSQLNNNIAITINVPQSSGSASAGNVILDLNNLEIASTNRNNIGILVVGQTNVIIRNGRIRNFSQGININNANTTGSNIIIDSILFTRNNTGIQVSGGENYLFRNCRVIQSTSNGIYLSQAQNCQFINCLSNDNQSNGYFLSGVSTVRFTNCIAYNNTLIGVSLQGVSDSRLLNCASNANLTGFSLTNNGSLNSNSIIFTACTAESNTTDGFFITGYGNILQNCQALSNVTGFDIYGTGHTILECIANYNTGYGINLHLSANNCQIRNNTTTGNAYGIYNSGTDNRIYTNFANDNSTNNFVGITNYVITPTTTTPINFTTNIAE